jgi:hypothetical protein
MVLDFFFVAYDCIENRLQHKNSDNVFVSRTISLKKGSFIKVFFF